jgi:hypothetical protein
MEGRFPGAIRMIRTNCTDPAQDRSFNDWYDGVHTPDVLSSGMVSRVVRYQNAERGDTGPGYIAIHELAWDDLDEVARHVARTRRRLTAGNGFHPALQIVKAQTWKRIGRAFSTPRTGRASVVGVFVVETHCADEARVEEFNRWYNDVHVPDLLDTRLFTSAYRFSAVAAGSLTGPVAPTETEAVAGSADPRPTFLVLYETDGDPVGAVAAFSRDHRPRLKAAGRFIDYIEVTWRGIYRQIGSVTKPL